MGHLNRHTAVKTFNESGVMIPQTLIRHYSVTVAGGAGQTSNFLTSDGLTKSGSNTFTFSNVRNVFAGTTTIQTTPEGPVHGGWSYNVTTGELITKFMESRTTAVLIGGSIEGLEMEENGTAIKITVIGD